MSLWFRGINSYAHIHPYLNTETGDFDQTINRESADPDNADAGNAVLTEGEYIAFTEVAPKGAEMISFGRFLVNPSPRPALPPLAMDLTKPDEAKIIYYNQDGKRAEPGAFYQIKFYYDQFPTCTMWVPRLWMTVSKLEDGTYQPTNDFTPYLGMGGHAIMVSEEGEFEKKAFQHLHSFLPTEPPGEFLFPFHGHMGPLPDGHYKVWVQFRHQGQATTIPIGLQYVNPPLPTNPARLCAE